MSLEELSFVSVKRSLSKGFASGGERAANFVTRIISDWESNFPRDILESASLSSGDSLSFLREDSINNIRFSEAVTSTFIIMKIPEMSY
eukprot:snap_masked-scaffold_6-processed-gene-8.36-mRNA-1 protein AED:1.00 eAED:1.00 QI:0/0/0/0/1/1/2/0/88